MKKTVTKPTDYTLKLDPKSARSFVRACRIATRSAKKLMAAVEALDASREAFRDAFEGVSLSELRKRGKHRR